MKQCRFCKRAPLQDETAELHNSSAKLQHLNCFKLHQRSRFYKYDTFTTDLGKLTGFLA